MKKIALCAMLLLSAMACKKESTPAPTTNAAPTSTGAQNYYYTYTFVGSDGVTRTMQTCCTVDHATWAIAQQGWYNVYKGGPC